MSFEQIEENPGFNSARERTSNSDSRLSNIDSDNDTSYYYD